MNRINWIDNSKVIAIFLMVLCHASLGGVPRAIIYQFHMPAFFIISGYLYKKRPIVKELRSFIIPIAFFSAIIWMFGASIECVLNRGSMLEMGGVIYNYSAKCIRTFWHTNDGTEVTLFTGLWFLVALLVVRLILKISLVNRFKYSIAVACILFTSVQSYLLGDSDIVNYYVFHAISAYPFVAVGLFLKEKGFRAEEQELNSILLALIAFIALTVVQGSPDMRDNIYGLNYSLFFVNAIAGSYILFALTSKIQLIQPTIIYSVGTLLILGTHTMIIKVTSVVLSKVLHLSHQTIVPIISSIIVMLVVYYPIKILMRKCPLLLGK